jgi:hypothetical protein
VIIWRPALDRAVDDHIALLFKNLVEGNTPEHFRAGVINLLEAYAKAEKILSDIIDKKNS